jgi:hypothetical protein
MRGLAMNGRVIVMVPLLALAAAACGSDTSAGGLASLDGSDGIVEAVEIDETVDEEEAMLAFAECLREQGLDVADPEMGEDGQFRIGAVLRPDGATGSLDREEMRAAMDVCRPLIEGVTQQFRDTDQTEMQDRLYEYAACMRENGYDMADPDFGAFGPGSGEGEPGPRVGPFGEIDPDDPVFQAASEACRDVFGGGLMPRGLGGDRPEGGA